MNKSTRQTARETPSGEPARTRILHAAARLYAAHGFAGTSMSRIALEAGVTKPLIFYHFETKERLFSSLLREAIEKCRQSDEEVLSREIPVREQIRELLKDHVSLARQQPAIYAFAYEALTRPGLLPLGFDYKAEGRRIFEGIVAGIEKGIRRGELRRFDPEVVAVTLLSTVGMYVSAVLSGEIDAVPDHLEASLFDLIMGGLEEVRG